MKRLVEMEMRWWYSIDDGISARIVKSCFPVARRTEMAFHRMLFRGIC